MANASPNNPHDSFFIRWMAFKALVQDLLKGTTPDDLGQLLDFSSAAPVKGEFLDERWRKLFADVTYQFKTTSGLTLDVVVIFEHKSYLPHVGESSTEKPIILQLMAYIKGVWEADYRQQTGYRVLLPVVFYHGEQPWPYGTNDLYKELFPEELPPALRYYQPTFHFILVDTSEYPDKRLLRDFENPMLRAAIAIMRDFKRPELFSELWRYLEGADDWLVDPMGFDFVQDLFVYWTALNKNERIDMEMVKEEIKKVRPKTSKVLISVHEATLLAGEKKGRKEGLIEGRMEERMENAQRMLEDKLPVEKVLQYTQLTREDIAHLLK